METPASPAPGSSSVPPLPPRKGLPPLAWVGIGCGVLALVAIVFLVAGFTLFSAKIKKIANEAEKNPAKFGAEMMVKMNPGLEKVKSDDAAGTITFRVKESGEEITMSYKDMQQGKFSMQTGSGKSVQIEAAPGAPGESGNVRITTSGGEAKLGAGSAADLPGWIEGESYPQTKEILNVYKTTADGVTNVVLTFTTDDAAGDVAAYYTGKLEAAGIKTSEGSISAGTAQTETIEGANSDASRTIRVNATTSEGGTTVVLQFEGAAAR